MNMQASVLVVILNYGTYDLTIRLIEQLHKNLDYQNYDILVIDNCSPNESERILRTKSDELNYSFIANKTNAGYAAGNNIGIRYGIEHGYEYSWILNNDVEIREKNVLKQLVEHMEKDAQCGAVGPMIYSLEGEVCFPYCRRPTFWSMTLGIAHEKKYRASRANISSRVYRLFGCCVLLRNSTMKLINCMDERTFLYGEEDILAERMRCKGYYSFYEASVSVTHMESASMKRMSKNKRKLQARETKRSMNLYLKEYRGYPFAARWICEMVRVAIIYFK